MNLSGNQKLNKSFKQKWQYDDSVTSLTFLSDNYFKFILKAQFCKFGATEKRHKQLVLIFFCLLSSKL